MRAHTTSVLDEVADHPQAKERLRVVVIRVRSSMEKSLLAFREGRRCSVLSREIGDLRTGTWIAWMM
jgi:hypothetical protein